MGRRAWKFVAVVAVLALATTACGDDDDEASGEGDASEAPPVFTITAAESEGALQFDIPSDIAGGVVTLKLVSPAANKQPHDIQLVRLTDGHTADELATLVGEEEVPTPEWIKDAGGVLTVGPGQSRTATVELEPHATYGFFCTESDEEAHKSHAELGMLGSFETGDDSGAEFPETDGRIVATEYDFTFEGLQPGTNSVTFENAGKQLHLALVVPIAEGKTFEDAKAAFLSEEEPEGPPPVDFERATGAEVFGPGQKGAITLDLDAGSYAVVCFISDYGTAGPPHLVKGMFKELVIS